MIEKREPIRKSISQRELYDALVKAAVTEPGDWFFMPLDGRNRGNTHSNVYRALSALFGEVRTDDTHVYVRIFKGITT